MTCQEMAASFGMDVVPAMVEALRSKAKRWSRAAGWPSRPRVIAAASGRLAARWITERTGPSRPAAPQVVGDGP